MDALSKLKAQMEQELELPLDGTTDTVIIKVRKPSLVKMAGEGKIPNHLLGIADDLIMGSDRKKEEEEEDKNLAKEYSKMLELYCVAAMVEPTFEEARDYLTDEQMMRIMDFATGGLQALGNFREVEEDARPNK